MKYEYILKEGKKETVLIKNENNQEATERLLYELYIRQVNKMQKRSIRYRYNYTDTQTIDFIDKSIGKIYIVRISGIPTTLGILDTNKLHQEA